jgi:hypothetical protein
MPRKTNPAHTYARKTARANRHAELMARHARHRAAVDAYMHAYNAWCDSGRIGPRPIDPR